MSVMHGRRYPPKPPNLPTLNPVKKRLTASHLPYKSVRNLAHGSDQYGIKRQVVKVPIEVANTVQCRPRNLPENAFFDVHIMHRLIKKPSYRNGLTKKCPVHFRASSSYIIRFVNIAVVISNVKQQASAALNKVSTGLRMRKMVPQKMTDSHFACKLSFPHKSG